MANVNYVYHNDVLYSNHIMHIIFYNLRPISVNIFKTQLACPHATITLLHKVSSEDCCYDTAVTASDDCHCGPPD